MIAWKDSVFFWQTRMNAWLGEISVGPTLPVTTRKDPTTVCVIKVSTETESLALVRIKQSVWIHFFRWISRTRVQAWRGALDTSQWRIHKSAEKGWYRYRETFLCEFSDLKLFRVRSQNPNPLPWPSVVKERLALWRFSWKIRRKKEENIFVKYHVYTPLSSPGSATVTDCTPGAMGHMKIWLDGCRWEKHEVTVFVYHSCLE